MQQLLDQGTARQIIRSLGESGQPPQRGALYLNVGTEPLLEKLRVDYLTDHCCAGIDGMDGGGTCKWVEANYGNGKTQFLRCVREMAWDLNYVTAFVELSHDECPLDRTDRVYGAVARALQAKPDRLADVDRVAGVDAVLSQLLDRMFPGVLTGPPDEPLRLQALEWIRGLRHTPVESTAFVNAAAELLLAKLQGDEEKARLLAIYLRGEQPPASELRKIGVYEQLNNSNGLRLLRSLCQLLQRSGLAAGTVLLFDEARRVLSLMSSKAQKVACENLLSVINRCNSGELPGTMFLYGVIPEFFTKFAEIYPALQTRCGPATRLKLEALANIKEHDLLTQIGQRITDIFRAAYPDFPEKVDFLDADLTLTVNEAARQILSGMGTRRLMVKGWVQALRSVLEGRTGGLSRDGAEKLLAGVSEELKGMETATVEAEGE